MKHTALSLSPAELPGPSAQVRSEGRLAVPRLRARPSPPSHHNRALRRAAMESVTTLHNSHPNPLSTQVNPLSEIEQILAGRYADGSSGKTADDPPDEYHIKWKARRREMGPAHRRVVTKQPRLASYCLLRFSAPPALCDR